LRAAARKEEKTSQELSKFTNGLYKKVDKKVYNCAEVIGYRAIAEHPEK